MLAPVVRAAQPERFHRPTPNAEGWIGPIHSPLREDKHPSFSIRPDSETDPGAYVDHGTGDKGSMAGLALLLGIDPKRDGGRLEQLEGPIQTGNVTLRTQPERTLEGFCRRRRLDRNTLEQDWNVRQTTHKGRPALRYPTQCEVDRIKYLDGEKPKNWWDGEGGRAHWYGLKGALKLGRDIYLVNGEPSVWACRQAGVPAVCLAAGEGTVPGEELVVELVKAGVRHVSVIYDNDPTGRRGAPEVVAALRAGGLDARALQLPADLGSGADVDDLHRRVGDEGLARSGPGPWTPGSTRGVAGAAIRSGPGPWTPGADRVARGAAPTPGGASP